MPNGLIGQVIAMIGFCEIRDIGGMCK